MLTIVIPATGRYIVLGRRLASALLNTCYDQDKLRVIIASDCDRVPAGVGHLPWVRQMWPASTYAKFRIGIAAMPLCAPGHVVLLDADTLPTGALWSTTMFTRAPLVAWRHPQERRGITPARYRSLVESDPGSPAFIPIEELSGVTYCSGMCMGGTLECAAAAFSQLEKDSLYDLARGYTNVWHDETHWNGYVHRNKAAVDIVHYNEVSTVFRISDKGGMDPVFLRS